MDCAEAEVMERASAKMANWYRMFEARVWDGNRNKGFFFGRGELYLRNRWNRVRNCDQRELGVKNLYVATTANWKMKSASGRKRTLPHSRGAHVQEKSADELPCLWGQVVKIPNRSRFSHIKSEPAELRPGP